MSATQSMKVNVPPKRPEGKPPETDFAAREAALKKWEAALLQKQKSLEVLEAKLNAQVFLQPVCSKCKGPLDTKEGETLQAPTSPLITPASPTPSDSASPNRAERISLSPMMPKKPQPKFEPPPLALGEELAPAEHPPRKPSTGRKPPPRPAAETETADTTPPATSSMVTPKKPVLGRAGTLPVLDQKDETPATVEGSPRPPVMPKKGRPLVGSGEHEKVEPEPAKPTGVVASAAASMKFVRPQLPIGLVRPTTPTPNPTSPPTTPGGASQSMKVGKTPSKFPTLSSVLPATPVVPTPASPPSTPAQGVTQPLPASTSFLQSEDISGDIAAFLSEHKKTMEAQNPTPKAPLTMFPGCTLEGFMVKKGAKVKNWKRRYFVLQASGKLMYFENSDGRKLMGQMVITHESCVGVRGGGPGEEGGLWVSPEPNGRIFEFEAGDSATRDKWIEAINKVIGPSNAPRQWQGEKKIKERTPSEPAAGGLTAASGATTASGPTKVIVRVPGLFFAHGEPQAMEFETTPETTAAQLSKLAMSCLRYLPGLLKDQIPTKLHLFKLETGEMLEDSQTIQPITELLFRAP